MKPAWLCWLGLLAAVAVGAQVQPAPAAGADAAGLSGAAAALARDSAALDAQEADCYQHFAVSGCLLDVQSRRRILRADQHREEAALHEQQAAERGAQQRARSLQKAEERQEQDAQRSAENAATNPYLVQQQKQAEHAARVPQSRASAADSVNAGPQAHGLSPAEQAANRERLARKQSDAQKKLQDVAKRLSDQAGKTATPLPLPP